MAGSTMVLIPGAAHAAIYENAPFANRAILDWAKTLK
ncbi:pimeloyl-ACP methyl ester carboxylesterase [Deinococcus humi]|uniref:Pimeloyl-ACP methyl ester carboxylesterase n=1 Tax=Deinococcus humi TaxID=662880 RepID=A0A7W8NCV1_9DEIO|nr:pimeloyl-ACP methyl ester carboxylesterase [Deinococcus humi]MBB5366108.1 pimeloyl-ACP methyl ester carboxylesterase [Deinococcus humi]